MEQLTKKKESDEDITNRELEKRFEAIIEKIIDRRLSHILKGAELIVKKSRKKGKR